MSLDTVPSEKQMQVMKSTNVRRAMKVVEEEVNRSKA
jgi:hypothetical protein